MIKYENGNYVWRKGDYKLDDELAEVLISLKEWVVITEKRIAKLEQALKEKNNG